MNIVRSHIIFEKFTEDSDPISDMGIGVKKLIDEWMNRYCQLTPSNFNKKTKDYYVINKSGLINVYGDVWVHKTPFDRRFPDYINFNIIHGSFDMGYRHYISLRGCPKIIYGYFRFNENNIQNLKYFPKEVHNNLYCEKNPGNFEPKDIRNRCRVGGKINGFY